jgi:hypothetical protein
MNTGNIYESPMIEIVGMETGQAVLTASFTGEEIYGWEDV